MIIKEVIERECCQDWDLVPLLGTVTQVDNGRVDMECRHKMCIHCRTVYEYYRFMDAAGSMDWGYRKVE